MDRYGLRHFPSEVWACIAAFLPGEQLGRLKFTGSKSIWYKLMSPNVMKSVFLGEDYLQFKRWPAFLNELPSVEELLICSPSDIWWNDMGLKLDQVPSKLRKLQIRKVKDLNSFFAGSNGTSLKLVEYVPNLEVLDFPDSSQSNHDWMAFVPRSLTTLSVFAWRDTIQLPGTLKHLKVTSMVYYESVEKIPTQLESITAESFVRALDIPNILPPSLQQLNVTQSFRVLHLGGLPGTLDTLNSISVDYLNLHQRPEALSLLPPRLTELYVCSVLPSSSWNYLPVSLTKLSFSASKYDETAAAKLITTNSDVYEARIFPWGSLPRSITFLQMFPRDHIFIDTPVELSSNQAFPPSLKTLNAPRFHLSPTAVKQLPGSLTRMSFENLCEHVCRHLPSSLTELISQATLMSPNLTKLLPRSLTSLQAGYCLPALRWFDYTSGAPLKSVTEHPDFSEHTLHSNFAARDLPPNITHLVLRNFTGLEISCSRQISRLEHLDLPSATDFTESSLHHLDYHITYLNLPKSGKITGRCFPSLPKYLTWINLNSSYSIEDSDIQHLPRALKEVHIDSATLLTDDCIQHFPAQLAILSIKRNNRINPSCYPFLPIPIRCATRTRSFQTQTWCVEFGRVEVDT